MTTVTKADILALEHLPAPKLRFQIGQDALPAGIRATATEVIFDGFKDDFDGWDIGPRRIVSLKRAGSLTNFRISNVACQALSAIDLRVGGGFDGITDFIVEGGYGKYDAASALKQGVSGTGRNIKVAHMPVLARGKFVGLFQDGVKFAGASGGQVIEDLYMGPQYAYSKTAAVPHADFLTCFAALDGTTIRRVFSNRVAPPAPAFASGCNNSARMLRNNGTDRVVEHVTIEDFIFNHDPNFPTYPVQVSSGGQPNFGPISFRNGWIAPARGGKYFHRSTNSQVAEWINVRDLHSDALIAPPTGARVS